MNVIPLRQQPQLPRLRLTLEVVVPAGHRRPNILYQRTGVANRLDGEWEAARGLLSDLAIEIGEMERQDAFMPPLDGGGP